MRTAKWWLPGAVNMARDEALLIGVDRFDDAFWPELLYAAKDARDMAKVLGDPARGDFDEIVLLIGSDHRDLDDLGAEIEWFMGDGDDAERFVIDRTTAIYVPKGLVHGPMNFLRVDRPVLNVAIGLDCGDYQ